MRSLWNRLTGRDRPRPAPVPAPPPRPAPPAAPKSAAPKPAATKPATAKPTHPVPAPPPKRNTSVHAEAPGGRHLSYAPNPDGNADPGEIVWTWVPFEDDPSQGKDRPVLIVGREGQHTALGLMLSSKSERDGQHNWLALGPGDWDRDARPSWLRLDRVLRMPDDSIRREGAVLDKKRFVRVADLLRRSYGWE